MDFSLKQDERWTLTQTGNWGLHRLDLNGDGDFIDTGELDDRGTFNVVVVADTTLPHASSARNRPLGLA